MRRMTSEALRLAIRRANKIHALHTLKPIGAISLDLFDGNREGNNKKAPREALNQALHH